MFVSHKPLVAVVNNDTAFLELMKELLDDEGYETLIHKEGSTAYQRVKKEQPALLILDIRLGAPEEGWNVLELLKLDPKTAGMPVIVCSADAVQLREKAPRLRELGCVTLEKPFDLAELLALVAQHVGPPRH
jgi:CheY-like chemotaxis protein